MAESLKVGDVVQLKSGGPKMTIEHIGRYGTSSDAKAKCTWFEDAKKHEGLFSPEALSRV
jgi:uncharacterized protein YodC (DUF2158 family)